MSVAAALNRRITQAAVGRHLPRRTVRVRLTLLYGGLFLLSGAALMAIAYALLVNAGFVFSIQNGPAVESGPGPQPAFPSLGPTHPTAEDDDALAGRLSSACASAASRGSPTRDLSPAQPASDRR